MVAGRAEGYSAYTTEGTYEYTCGQFYLRVWGDLWIFQGFYCFLFVIIFIIIIIIIIIITVIYKYCFFYIFFLVLFSISIIVLIHTHTNTHTHTHTHTHIHTQYLDDLIILNTTTNQWSVPKKVFGTPPSPRAWHSAVAFGVCVCVCVCDEMYYVVFYAT